jgi:hypothetical protein
MTVRLKSTGEHDTSMWISKREKENKKAEKQCKRRIVRCCFAVDSACGNVVVLTTAFMVSVLVVIRARNSAGWR